MTRSGVGRGMDWLLPVAALLALAGYVGPWVAHQAAGLVITGLDLAEYVKFLPQVRSGELQIWREIFYLPPVALSLSLSLWAFRREVGLPIWARLGMLLLAGVAALNLLPPAWTPGRLTTPEFRLQTGIMALCLALAGIAPLLALLPRWVGVAVAGLGPLLGSAAAVVAFLRLTPALDALYNRPVQMGWGVPGLILGSLLLSVAALSHLRRADRPTHQPGNQSP